MTTDAPPAPPRFIVKKANTEMLGTVLNELPDGYVAEVRHQEGSNWVIVAERAQESLSVEMVGEPILRQTFQMPIDPDLRRIIEGEPREPRSVLAEAGIAGVAAPGGPIRGVEDPEPDYGTAAFDAVWEVVRPWDIERVSGKGYAGATGTDVQIILDALRPFFRSGTLSSPGPEQGGV